MIGEKKYPIYRFVVWYTLEHPSKYDDEVNRLDGCRMFQQPLTPSEIERELEKFWVQNLVADRYSSNSLADCGAVAIEQSVELVEYETWCLTWFSHYTLNVHLSDDELLKSFRQFVKRKEEADLNLRFLRGPRREGVEYYCLMGAEEKWRWKGPCRCEHCQRQEVVRIDH